LTIGIPLKKAVVRHTTIKTHIMYPFLI